jgi:N6-L-threonylcarbamoyladenine synthase
MEQGMPFEQIASEVYDVLSRLIIKTLDIFAPPSNTVLVTGGVASSAHLKDILNERSEKRGGKYSYTFSQPQYASDNAAGVAIIGRNLYYVKGDENTAWLSF